MTRAIGRMSILHGSEKVEGAFGRGGRNSNC